MATKRKKKASTTKGPHCKNVKRSDGTRRKMCWDAKGKITSAAKVAAYNKRKKGKRAA
jgi:hypothetical protein